VAIENARLVEQQKQRAEQSAIAAERDRLAAELHDNLAQTLGFLNLKSDRVRELLGDRQLDEASDELAQMNHAIGTAYHQVRAALTGLREPSPDADNLRARLNDCVLTSGIIFSPQAFSLKNVRTSCWNCLPPAG